MSRYLLYLLLFMSGVLLPSLMVAQPVLNERDLSTLSVRERTIATRYEGCLHFAGEFSGDPQLDQYVQRRVEELRCDHIDRDIAQLRYDHRGVLVLKNKPVIKALSKIERAYDIAR